MKIYDPATKTWTDSTGEKCPICCTPWHISGFIHEYKDCLKCGKQSEDILKESKKDIQLQQLDSLYGFYKD